MNGSTWYSNRSSQRLGGGIHEVEQISALSAKVDNVATMVQKLSQITLQNQNVSYVSTPSTPIRQVLICDLCGGGHNLGECLNEDTNSQSSVEHIDLVGYNRPQQSFQPQRAYNPNTSWSNPMGAANPQHFGNRGSPPGFQGQSNYRGAPPQQFRPTQGFQPQAPTIQPRPPLPTLEAPPPPNWEAMMEIDENQIANQASTSSTKVTGKLPACPENPREHVNAIVTRSGKKLEEPPLPVDKLTKAKKGSMIVDFGEEKVAFNVLEDPNSRVVEKCYRDDVMGSKTHGEDVEKVEKGRLLGLKTCDRNFNEASYGGSLTDQPE
nr:uncharacterized protein LOC109166769 [Ipomoea batatas]